MLGSATMVGLASSSTQTASMTSLTAAGGFLKLCGAHGGGLGLASGPARQARWPARPREVGPTARLRQGSKRDCPCHPAAPGSANS